MVTDQYNWLLRVEEFWSMSQHEGPAHYGNDANFMTRPEVHRPIGDPVQLTEPGDEVAYEIVVEDHDGRQVVEYDSPE